MKNKTSLPKRIQLLGLTLCALIGSAISSQAQSGTWTNDVFTTTLWSDPTNWLDGIIADGIGTTADFSTANITNNVTVTVDTSRTVGDLFIGDANVASVASWTIADGGGLPLTLDNTTTSNSNIRVTTATGGVTNLVTGWGNATITATLAGTNTLVKTGPGHLILNSAGNSYFGGTVISNGMLQLGVANAAGNANSVQLGSPSAPIIFRGGSLRLQNAAIPGNNPGNGGAGIAALVNPIFVEAGQTGSIYLSARAFPAISSTVTGGGTLNMHFDFVRCNVDGDYSGFTGQLNFIPTTRQATEELRFGATFVGASLANARVTITSNVLNNSTALMYNNGPANQVLVIGELSCNIQNFVTVQANNGGAGAGNSLPFVMRVGGLNTDSTFSGNFSVNGVANGVGIVKEGTGTWILNGATVENNGVTIVSNGVMQVGSGTTGKLGRTQVVTNFATLAFGRTDTLAVTNVIDGPGTLMQRGAGTLILAPLNGTNLYTGKTIVTNGLLAPVTELALGPNPGGSVADQLTLSGGGLRSTNNLTIDDANRGITLGSAGGTLSPDTNTTLTVVSTVTGGGNLSVNGVGTATLTGANNYTGKTILLAGTLSEASESPLGTAPGGPVADQLTLNGGTFRSTASFSIDDANRGITVGASGGTVSPDPATTLTLSEPIVGSGALTKANTGILTINGADSRTGNTLINQGRLAISASGSLSASPLISVASGAVFDVSALGGGYSLGSGRSLGGNGSVVGNVTAASGSTLLAGTSIGSLTFSNNLTMSGGATNLVEISSTTNDVIVVTGNLTLSGVNAITLNVLSALPVGTYQLMRYGGTLTGGTGNLVLLGYPPSRLAAVLVHNAGTKSIDLVISGSAATLTWVGGAGGNAWDVITTTNWLNGASLDFFYNADTVAFNNVGAANPNVNLVGNLSPAVGTVNSSTDYSFSGNGKVTGLSILVKDGANKLTVTSTNDYSGGTLISAGTVQIGNGTASGSLGTGNVTNNAALTYNVPGTHVAANLISGSGTLTVQGGTVALTGNNTYNGGSVINGGTTLQVGNAGASGSLGTGGVTDNGSLVYRRTGVVTNVGAITGGGSLTVLSGTVALASDNSYGGSTLVNAATLQVGAGGTSGTVGSTGSVTLTNGAALAFNRSDVLTNTVAIIGTNGILIQAGTGALVITNDNNNLSQVIVSAGRLQIGDGGDASGSLGGAVVTNNATLVLNRPDAITFSNRVVGTGSLVQVSTNIVTVMIPGGANTYSGGTTISNSFVILSAGTPVTEVGAQNVNSTALGTGPVTFQGNSTLQLESATVQDPFGNGVGNFANPIVVPAGQTATMWLPGRFQLSSSVSGAGTLNYGANYVRGNIQGGEWTNFTGILNIITNVVNTNSVLHDFRAFNPTGFPRARMNLGDAVTMYWRGAANAVVPIGELSGSEVGAVITGTGGAEGGNNVTWRIGGLNTDSTYGGIFAGTVLVGIIKEGTGKLTLTGANTHIGNTTISNGVLALAPNSGLLDGTINNTPNIAIISPGILDVSATANQTLNVGSATAQVLRGNGTLRGSLLVDFSGILSPGLSVGTLTVTNDAVISGIYSNEFSRLAPQTSDRLVARNITINGGQLVMVNVGNNLFTGDTFQIFQANGGTISGAFFSVTGGVPPGGSWDTNNLTVNGTITAIVPPSPVLTNSVSGGGTTLDFSWGIEYFGWRLYIQTNSITTGLGTNWTPIIGTEFGITFSVPINTGDSTNCVFFRLQYP